MYHKSMYLFQRAATSLNFIQTKEFSKIMNGKFYLHLKLNIENEWVDDKLLFGQLQELNDAWKSAEAFLTSKDNIKVKKASKLDHIVKNYATNIKLPKLLNFLDKCSAAHGIECRVPFLDHNLVTFIYSNEDKFKIINGSQKYPLKKWLKQISSKNLEMVHCSYN